MDQQERIRTAASLLQQAVEQLQVETGQSSGRSRSPELQAISKATSSSAPQSARIQPELSKLIGFRASSSSSGKRRQSSSSFPAKLRQRGRRTNTGWAHCFVCLADKFRQYVSSGLCRWSLEKAGLGEQRLTFPSEGYCQKVHD